MLYMICSQGDEPLFQMWADTPPTLEDMAQSAARFFNYESVEALAQANPDLWLGWFPIQ